MYINDFVSEVVKNDYFQVTFDHFCRQQYNLSNNDRGKNRLNYKIKQIQACLLSSMVQIYNTFQGTFVNFL
jgi:hypothetical protein